MVEDSIPTSVVCTSTSVVQTSYIDMNVSPYVVKNVSSYNCPNLCKYRTDTMYMTVIADTPRSEEKLRVPLGYLTKIVRSQ